MMRKRQLNALRQSRRGERLLKADLQAALPLIGEFAGKERTEKFEQIGPAVEVQPDVIRV